MIHLLMSDAMINNTNMWQTLLGVLVMIVVILGMIFAFAAILVIPIEVEDFDEEEFPK